MSKTVNLQPWLDYFDMLRTYEQKGYLEMHPEKQEAFVTHAALLTLFPCNVTVEGGTSGPVSGTVTAQLAHDVADTFRRIRAYAAWLSRKGTPHPDRVFALHIVKDDAPHDLLLTLLYTGQKRRWWWPWRRVDVIETIEYDTGGTPTDAHDAADMTEAPNYQPPSSTL